MSVTGGGTAESNHNNCQSDGAHEPNSLESAEGRGTAREKRAGERSNFQLFSIWQPQTQNKTKAEVQKSRRSQKPHPLPFECLSNPFNGAFSKVPKKDRGSTRKERSSSPHTTRRDDARGRESRASSRRVV